MAKGRLDAAVSGRRGAGADAPAPLVYAASAAAGARRHGHREYQCDWA